ncbi:MULTISPECIES: GAF domain-containing protein [Cyanophyceae]|uniref:GAF domain-containing protein n=1 Tax=Cyanophyceae TaxID=3028117 RepID=UPI001685D1F5|nr:MULTISPECIES: GAF domain-containing protein [Cyanophyceae]MBD1914593.1 GAF domain-containing protein [Phormidium sp. FACHB-77]MBD2030317.1 GAF domain-containing protein [Phormidium sp. FACHB-322]MBD2049862.1 GAF domain-containing protein [Leptolyngbya sp. FACHB-60]
MPQALRVANRNPLAQAFDSLQRIHQSLDLAVVLLTAVAEVRQLLQVERVFLFRFKPDGSGVVEVEDCAPSCLPLQGQRVYDESFADKWASVYAQGRVQAVGDMEQAGLTPCHLELLRGLGVRANLVVPLLAQGRLWGLLVAQHCSAPRPWQELEVQMMQQLAVQVGLAIQQAELYQQLQAELTVHRQAEAQLLQQAERSHDRHLESISTLAGGIAHDLSDILTPIVLAAEMLKQSTLDSGQQQQWLNRIHTSAHRGVSLIEQVLSFAQGMGGQRAEIQLAYLLGELVQTLQEICPAGITVTSCLRQSRLWTVHTSATQLHQVFMNLCLNGFEAMAQGGTLHLEARNVWWRGTPGHPQLRPGAYVVVTVTDTGTGMTAAVCDRSCDPFFTTRAEAGHSGLGLSTALGLVKGYGGWLKISSQPGHGTTVEVYLPASVEPAELTLAPIPAGLNGGNALVLLVMADDPAREWHRALLESYGYQVLLAEEGADAIALFIQHQTELGAVVLDLALPTLNGTAILRRMHHILPALPFVTLGDGDLGEVAVTILDSPNGAALLSTLAQVCLPTQA